MTATAIIIISASAALNLYLVITTIRIRKKYIPPESREEFLLYGYKLAVMNVLQMTMRENILDRITVYKIVTKVNDFPIVDESNFMFVMRGEGVDTKIDTRRLPPLARYADREDEPIINTVK